MKLLLALALAAASLTGCQSSTYSFYTTDSGSPAPSALAPAGYDFRADTTFEDSHPGQCDAELLHASSPSVVVYTCTR